MIDENKHDSFVVSDKTSNDTPRNEQQRLAEWCPAFAEGLPDWDLLPPQMGIFRKA